MAQLIFILSWIEFSVFFLISAGFIITSVLERKWRAVRLACLILLPLLIAFLLLLILPFPFLMWIRFGLIILGGLMVSVLVLPYGRRERTRIAGKQERVDEREAIFHRFYRIRPGTREFNDFYRSHPEKKEFDDKVRSLPLLGYPGSRTFDELTSPFSAATFDVIEKMVTDVEWAPQSVSGKPIRASKEEFSRRIKGFARYLGADLVGITPINSAYVYSHIGRSQGKWGAPINLNHKNAIAIAVEMKYPMLRHSPDSPTTTETAIRYFEAAKVAMILGRYIHFLGYEARPHVDGNYRVMCGPIAADAGLGELGRLGLLITPEFGARIRLAVVTTDLPLVHDAPIAFGVQDFCTICKKCAANCPSGAIEDNGKKICKGVEKWQSDQESCYRFWRLQGTDCSFCIKVCPYSHPGTLLHNMVRWITGQNPLSRRLALLGDDFFYGRRPKTTFPVPDWHQKS
jgi:reductive dehalogenase